jgi:hypothetical protein
MCTLSEIFDAVELDDASDGIIILHELMVGNADRSPALVAAIQGAIASIQDGSFGTTEPVSAPAKTTSSTTASKASV